MHEANYLVVAPLVWGLAVFVYVAMNGLDLDELPATAGRVARQQSR